MIPKIIHQYWDGSLPEEYKKYSEDIISLNSDFNYFIWDKKSVIERYPNHYLTKYIKQSNNPTVCSDIARIILLDIMGGIYLDSDMKPEKKIPISMLEHECFSCYENEYYLGQTLANGAVGSVPGSCFIKSLISEITKINIKKIQNINKQNSWKILGPMLWTKVFFDSYPNQYIFCYPSWYFIPNHYIDNTTGKHGYVMTHIWKSKYDNQRRLYITHFTHGKKVNLIEDYIELKNFQE